MNSKNLEILNILVIILAIIIIIFLTCQNNLSEGFSSEFYQIKNFASADEPIDRMKQIIPNIVDMSNYEKTEEPLFKVFIMFEDPDGERYILGEGTSELNFISKSKQEYENIMTNDDEKKKFIFELKENDSKSNEFILKGDKYNYKINLVQKRKNDENKVYFNIFISQEDDESTLQILQRNSDTDTNFKFVNIKDLDKKSHTKNKFFFLPYFCPVESKFVEGKSIHQPDLGTSSQSDCYNKSYNLIFA